MDKNMNENNELLNELDAHDKFVEKLKVFPYNPKGYEEVYAKINKCSNGEIVVSLINDAMLKADQEYFSDKNIEKEYYVPYVYEFVVDKVYEEKILNIVEISKWYVASLSANIDSHNEDKSIKGSLYFMASVFNPQNNMYLIFKNSIECFGEFNNVLEGSKKNNSIDTIIERYYINTYSILSDEKIKKCLKYDYTDLTVYNVGQGNMVYVSDKSNKNRILFDVGVEKNNKIFNSKVENYLKKIKPSMIVLSHWDLDHILGVKFIKDEKWPKIWIAPNITECKGGIILSAHRLALYLSKNKYLHMVGENYSGKIVYELRNMKIYKGNITAKYAKKSASDKDNNNGLIITIKNDNFNTILPGDCEFSAWPDDIAINKVPYDVLMLPHHGADVYLPENKVYDNLFMLGVVSYGENNTYNHPASMIMRQLKDFYKCDIVETPNYDEIKIKIRKNYIELICIGNRIGFKKWIFKTLEQYHIVKSDNCGLYVNDIS